VIGHLLMLALGLFLSALFSGIETGFYRVTRVRLVIDSRKGSRISRGLLWMTNNPSLFVATTLIGNNLANYITSLAIVLLASSIFSPGAYAVELLAPIVLAPILFVYGELLPKNLFFYAPNFLLRRTGPIFLVFAILFAPASALLWVFARFLQWIVGESPERARLTLARTELARLLKESQESGLLRPIQWRLAQGLFAVAHRTVLDFCVPVSRIPAVKFDADKSEVLRLARRHRTAAIPIYETQGRTRHLTGYVRVIDLSLTEGNRINPVRPLPEIPQTATHIAALTKLQSDQETMARIVNDKKETIGIITTQQLIEPLFRHE